MSSKILEEEFPRGWEDGCVIGSIKRNRDGSITASIQIYIHGNTRDYYETYRKIRLKREKKEKKKTDEQ